MIRDIIRSEYLSRSCFIARFVDISVDRPEISRLLIISNNWESTKLLVSSVPKSSIINNSLLYMYLHKSSSSNFLIHNISTKIDSNNSPADRYKLVNRYQGVL